MARTSCTCACCRWVFNVQPRKFPLLHVSHVVSGPFLNMYSAKLKVHEVHKTNHGIAPWISKPVTGYALYNLRWGLSWTGWRPCMYSEARSQQDQGDKASYIYIYIAEQTGSRMPDIFFRGMLLAFGTWKPRSHAFFSFPFTDLQMTASKSVLFWFKSSLCMPGLKPPIQNLMPSSPLAEQTIVSAV